VTHDEVPQEFADCRYARISKLVGDWNALAKPMEPAFDRNRGRPMDPVVYLKIFLVGALEGIRYDTQLASRIDDSRRLREFLGYNLTQQTPDHSSISLARTKISRSCDLQPLLERIVEICLAGGLGDGSVTAVDATLIPANASLESLRHVQTGLAPRAHFHQAKVEAAKAKAAATLEPATAVQPTEVQPEIKVEPSPDPGAGPAVVAAVAEPTVAVAEPTVAVAEPTVAVDAVTKNAAAVEPEQPAAPVKATRRTVSNEQFLSLTDRDARIAKKHGKAADMCYQATTMVDKSRIILAVHVGHADQGEVEAALPVVTRGLDQLKERQSEAPFVLADKGYDAAAFSQQVEDHGGVPLTFLRVTSETKPEELRRAKFSYLEDIDAYRCPHGKLLPMRSREPQRERSRYGSNASDCAACPLRQQCLEPGAQVRTLSRMYSEASRERMRELAATEPAKQILRERGSIVEGPFGFSKEYGGLGLINCRGIAKAAVKVVFSAVTWNLLRLLHHVFVDPTRERSKNRRAARQEQRRQERAAKSKTGEVDSPIFGLSICLTALLQASSSLFGRLWARRQILPSSYSWSS